MRQRSIWRSVSSFLSRLPGPMPWELGLRSSMMSLILVVQARFLLSRKSKSYCMQREKKDPFGNAYNSRSNAQWKTCQGTRPLLPLLRIGRWNVQPQRHCPDLWRNGKQRPLGYRLVFIYPSAILRHPSPHADSTPIACPGSLPKGCKPTRHTHSVSRQDSTI